MRTKIAIALLALPWLAAATADEPTEVRQPEPEAGPRTERPHEPADADEAPQRGDRRLTVYVPPPRGAARTRVGGGTRSALRVPPLHALVPDHVGLTTRAQPTLAWYVGGSAPVRLDLTLLRDGAAEPLLETRIAPEVEAGIGEASLARFDVELEEGVVYEWFVALVGDAEQRDADVVAGGAIERVTPSPELVAELAGPEPDYATFARHGVWYDALAELGRRIAAGDPSLRAERAALLEQVGLDAAATHDRRQGDGEGAPAR